MNSSLLNEESFDFEDFELGVEEISYILNKKDVNCIRELGGVEGIARKLRVDPKVGLLDKSDFKHRIATYGTNEVSPPRRTSFFRLVLRALNDLTLQILLGVAVVSLVISLAIPKEMHSGDEGGDDWIEGASILLTVSVVTLVTAVNEYQRDKQFERLDKVKYNFKVKVRRNGIEEMLETFKIVVGDVVLLEAGDQAPGDGLYIGGCNLSMDESSMTGENEPVKKDEERCFLMSGTHVADGIGEMLVLATGENSEYGKMMRSLKVKNTPTPLQRRLDNLAKLVGKIGTAAALATFLALMIRWVIRVVPVPWKWAYLLDWVKYFVISITIVVVAIPEGLSLAVTITLAYSMKYMLRDQILVRRLASCETMGGATSICSDKTGTLTENRMTVLKGWIAGGIFEDTSAVELSDAVVQILGEGISVNSKASVNFESASHEMVGSRTEFLKRNVWLQSFSNRVLPTIASTARARQN
ncbi:uncharacterized protein LOC126314429 isoform X2 [Schistocerca gregaria]|uniref:uncharacterized protein LOC126314429 isoform X2 n=1 Tax=Schistocerca gregaria TaxID=7010 RepID=UPI00211E7F33|nr:uncharacterized protein LOC126314429 isoform X2 [Schistocerca gregaria]